MNRSERLISSEYLSVARSRTRSSNYTVSSLENWRRDVCERIRLAEHANWMVSMVVWLENGTRIVRTHKRTWTGCAVDTFLQRKAAVTPVARTYESQRGIWKIKSVSYSQKATVWDITNCCTRKRRHHWHAIALKLLSTEVQWSLWTALHAVEITVPRV